MLEVVAMPIRVTCPHCQGAYNLADEVRGKKVRCKSCKEIFTAEEEAPAPRETPSERRKGIATEPAARKASPVRRDGDEDRPTVKKKPRRSDEDDDRPARPGDGKGPSTGLIIG